MLVIESKKALRDRAIELARQGAFRDDDSTSEASLIAAIDDCVPEIIELQQRLGDEIWEQLLSLDPEHEACRREGHMWTRYIRLPEVPKGGFGRYANQRHCRGCGMTYTVWIAWNGRRNSSPKYDDGSNGYYLKGATGDQRVTRADMWLIEQYRFIAHAMSLAERRVAGRKAETGGRHLSAVA